MQQKWDELNLERYNKRIDCIIAFRGQHIPPELDKGYEMHHIQLACKDGAGDYIKKNSKTRFKDHSTHYNCLYTSYEEHYLLHECLAEDNPHDRDIIYSFKCIRDMKNEHGELYKCTAEEYQHSKELLSVNYKPWNAGLKDCYSSAILLKMSVGRKGKNLGHVPYGIPEARKAAASKGGKANKGVKKSFRSDEHRQHLSEAGKRLKWFTNGIEDTRAEICPEGWWAGHTKGKILDMNTRRWYTNGEINTFTSIKPEGVEWREGMVRKKS